MTNAVAFLVKLLEIAKPYGQTNVPNLLSGFVQGASIIYTSSRMSHNNEGMIFSKSGDNDARGSVDS